MQICLLPTWSSGWWCYENSFFIMLTMDGGHTCVTFTREMRHSISSMSERQPMKRTRSRASDSSFISCVREKSKCEDMDW